MTIARAIRLLLGLAAMLIAAWAFIDVGNRVVQEWRDDFFPILLDAFRYDVSSETVGHGPLFALPKDFTTAVFYINTNLFDAAGIDWRDVQKNGWTWAKFEADMAKIRDLRDRPEY